MRRLSGPEKLAAGGAINRRVNSVLVACLRQQYPAWPEERIQRKQKQITLIASLDPGCTLPEQFLAPVE